MYCSDSLTNYDNLCIVMICNSYNVILGISGPVHILSSRVAHYGFKPAGLSASGRSPPWSSGFKGSTLYTYRFRPAGLGTSGRSCP